MKNDEGSAKQLSLNKVFTYVDKINIQMISLTIFNPPCSVFV